MKILVVSDATNFALTDVYNGYINALEQLKIPYESHPYHHFRGICSDATCFHRIHSLVLTKPKEFTHIMFIGGLNVPDYIFDSLYHIKSIVIATEDPHSFDPMKHKLQKINYYFSNERSIGESKKFKNTYYCPTAGDTQECGRIPRDFLDEKYKSDILFLGAIYPNRRKLLESIIPFVEEKNLSLKICGHVHYMPKNSPLWKYVFDARTIPHLETVKYYNGAKIVLNMLRDTTWNPRTKSGKNPHNRSKFTADSLNPRAYEVPLCQSFMLLEDNRIEAKEVFTDTEVGFFSNEESLIERLQYFMFGKGKPKINDMIIKAYNKVSTKHTYLHRMLYVKSILEQDSN
jgi:spore maturation protein CgeB